MLMVELFEARLNFYNLIVLPAVLGIGNDAACTLCIGTKRRARDPYVGYCAPQVNTLRWARLRRWLGLLGYSSAFILD